MRVVPPDGFSLPTFFQDIYTFQGWEVFPGHKTKGKDIVGAMASMGIPDDLSGKRVLDIAPWNGFFGFECMRRGAGSLVSLGPDDPNVTGYHRVRELLEIDNCSYIRGSVYELDPGIHGTFDMVLFPGVIYHLRHPLLALDRIYDVATAELYVDSPIIDFVPPDQTISQDVKSEIASHSEALHCMPLVHFSKSTETRDFYNWFLPNRRALRDFVESSGFNIQHFEHNRTWAYLKAVKGVRPFTPLIEGWNPAKFRPNN